MPDLARMVPIASITPFNLGLGSASEATMISALGRPIPPIDADGCRNAQASPAVAPLLRRASVGAVQLYGIAPAVESLSAVLGQAFAAEPALADALESDGMLCVRLRRPTRGGASTHLSNHSWGTAVDLKLKGAAPPAATGAQIPWFIAFLIPFFNRAGWYSGVAFHDDMHFEVADQTIHAWAAAGAFRTPALAR
jgi:hypothetical protein